MPRTTTTLDLSAAQNLVTADAFATSRGLPLNHFVTIHWNLIDGDPDARRRFARLQELARHWLARRGLPLAWLWVHERGKTDELHTHVLVHLPRGRVASFVRSLERWLGGQIAAGLLDVRPRRDDGALRYVLKDVNPLDYARLQIPRPFSHRRSTRPIDGKRAGVSQALGPAARARARPLVGFDLERAA